MTCSGWTLCVWAITLVVIQLSSTKVRCQSSSGLPDDEQDSKCTTRLAECTRINIRSIMYNNSTELTQCICNANKTNCTCPALFSQLNISGDTAVTDRLFVYQYYTTLAGEVIIQSTLVQENSTSQFTLNNINGSALLALQTDSCSEVTVSFQTLGQSGFSHFATVCIGAGFAGPPTNIQATFSIDCAVSDIKAAIIAVTWQRPDNFQQLDSYQLKVRPTANARCLGVDILIDGISSNATEFTIRSDNGNPYPRLECDYDITVTSNSLQGRFNSSSLVHRINTKLSIMESCGGVFDYSAVSYNLTVMWSLQPNTCPNKIIISSYSVTILQGASLIGGGPEIQSVLVEPIFRPPQNLTWTVAGLPPLRTGYRFLIHPTTEPLTDTCDVQAPPVPPFPLTNITAEWLSLPDEDGYVLAVHWDSPDPVGVLVGYQLWIGRQSLPPTVAPESVSGLNVLPLTEIPPQTQEYNDSGIIYNRLAIGLEAIHVQMRATNELCKLVVPPCFSDWSEAVVLPLPIPPQQTTLLPSSTRGSTATVNTASPATSSLPAASPAVWAAAGGAMILIVIATIFIVTVVALCYIRRRSKHQSYPSTPDLILPPPPPPYIGIQQQPNDKWEIPWECLEVYEDEELGSGEFGEVFLGKLWMFYNAQVRKTSTVRRPSHDPVAEHMPVAVKMLRGPANEEEKESFLKEIEMMKSVSSTSDELSRFVVNMLGCITRAEPLMLVVEYVKYGNLLNFLRNLRKRIEAAKNGDSTPIPYPYLEPLGAYSQLDSQKKLEMTTLTERQILDSARQIAAGMEFLSGLGIVHRDLACRNILVGEKMTLKISDFGLSRVVGQDEVYTLTNHGRLPLRWMALESIFRRQFTTASDVWSFGVTVWEICTLGKFPYAALTEKDLLTMLKNGYRLEQPENCTDEMYDIIQACWHPDVSARPKFADLHVIFDQFLSHHTEELYPYIDIGFTNMPYKFDHLAPKSEQDIKSEDILDLDTGEYCGETAGADRYSGDTTLELNSSKERGDHRDEQTTETKATLTQKDREGYVQYRAKSKERRSKERRNGVVKGPYDELRLEDYMLLVEKAKEARKKQILAAESSGQEESPATHHSPAASNDTLRRDSVMKTLSTITEASCEDEGFSDGDHKAVAVTHQTVRGYDIQANNQPIAMSDYDKAVSVKAVIVGGYDETAI